MLLKTSVCTVTDIGMGQSYAGILPCYFSLAPMELVIEMVALHLKKIQEGGITPSFPIHQNIAT